MKLKKLFLSALVLVTLHVSADEYPSYLKMRGDMIDGCDENTVPKNLVIPDGVKGILDLNCRSLNSITIPGSVTEIGFTVLRDLPYSVNIINFGGTKAQWFDLTGGWLIEKKVHCSDGDFEFNGNLVIPEGTTKIIGGFQDGCDITSITIPSSVKEIIGEKAFHYWSHWDGENPIRCDITFRGTKAQWIFELGGLNQVGDNVTVHCSDGDAKSIDKNAKKAVIPSGITKIGGGAFKGWKSLESVTIPDSVTIIGDWAFTGCTSLKSITIPDSVTIIGDWAFSGCTSLKNITFRGTKAQWTFGLAGFNAVRNNVTVHCSDGNAERINENARKITIPADVTKISREAFSGCTSLKDITFGGSKAQWTFELAGFNSVWNDITVHCSDGDAEPINKSSRKIVIPSGVTAIGDYAFNYYDSLESVTIPDSVRVIGNDVFEDCYSLKNINFGGTKAQWTFGLAGFNAVKYKIIVHCSDGDVEPINKSSRKIDIPSDVTKIGSYAFKGFSSLTSVTIPDSVTEIGNWAFQDCNSLKTITFTGSREKLEEIKIGKGNENFLRANLSCAYETEAERLAEVERNERLMSTIIGKISKGEKNIKLKGSYSDEDLKSLNDAIAKANQKIDLDLSNAQKMPSLEWLTNFYNIEKVRLPKGLGKITVNLEEAKKIVPHPESKNIFAKDGLLYTNMGKTVYAVVEDSKSYTIPEGTKEIKASVFKDSGLESISLPKSLANIWEYAFEGCTNLKTVNYAGSKKAWKNIYINDDGKGNKLLHKAKFVYGEK